MKGRGSRNITVELKKTVIHQCQIPCQNWSAGRSLSKIAEEGNMVNIDRGRRRGEENKSGIPDRWNWSHKPGKYEWFICIRTVMGYGIGGKNKSSNLGGSLWVLGPCWPHLIISELCSCVSGGEKPPIFLCRTDSDTQWHHSGQK